jgi:2-C-methyl-D-erythritol 4-phosphate cytidylyltransferase
MRYWLVMPAAGSGRRFGGAKQYALLDGRTVLETALQPFLDDPQCCGGALVLAGTDPQRQRLATMVGERLLIVEGGAERAHSVCNGLAALQHRATADDWVLVHDAARPLLSAADLARLLSIGGSDEVGALLAAPVADTVKRARGHALAAGGVRCEATVPREALWLAQTPQMFRYAPLRSALERAILEQRQPTDEAQAMQWQGQDALLVQALDSNFKLTTAADLWLASAILRSRREASAAAGLSAGQAPKERLP